MVTFGSHQLLVGMAGNIMKLLTLQWMFTAVYGYPEQVYFCLLDLLANGVNFCQNA